MILFTVGNKETIPCSDTYTRDYSYGLNPEARDIGAPQSFFHNAVFIRNAVLYTLLSLTTRIIRMPAPLLMRFIKNLLHSDTNIDFVQKWVKKDRGRRVNSIRGTPRRIVERMRSTDEPT
ncbi:uncharacterized protein LOC110117059 [Athalia rosae]|uniref:uncharacterized protein LOC110117059 n=1 Tax=Athalia rosae TaxID=37344 RepID=UPI00203483AE|nr:uncharacterized protein LOC110117059 [Athalia rosae]